MPVVYEHLHTVRPEEIDRLGHANNVAYIRWMLDAAVAHSAVQGWDTAAYERLGAVWVVRSHTIEYLRPAFCAEELAVRTWVSSFGRCTSLRRYEIVRPADARTLAKAATQWAFVDLATRMPTRIRPEVVTAFELHSDTDASGP